MHIQYKWPSLLLVLLLTATSSACTDSTFADPQDVVYLTPMNAHKVEAGPVEDQIPQFRSEEDDNYKQVREQFSRRAGLLLQREDVVSQLESIEQVYYLSGYYLELIKIYQDHIEEFGVTNIAGPSLVFAYVQTGQDRLARELILRLKEDAPEDPLTWVVAGRYHLQNSQSSAREAREARDSFQRALALDPNLGNFRGMNATVLRAQIDDLNRRIPPEQLAASDSSPSELQEQRDLLALTETAEQEESPGEGQQELEPESLDRDESALFEEQEIALLEAPPAAEPVAEESAAHFIALGRAELQQGSSRLEASQAHFRRALEIEPENLDAAIGLLLIAGRSGAPEEMLTQQIQRIEEHPALTARQAYEMALFTMRSLNDRDLANMLLQRVQDLDPSFARRVNTDALIQR